MFVRLGSNVDNGGWRNIALTSERTLGRTSWIVGYPEAIRFLPSWPSHESHSGSADLLSSENLVLPISLRRFRVQFLSNGKFLS